MAATESPRASVTKAAPNSGLVLVLNALEHGHHRRAFCGGGAVGGIGTGGAERFHRMLQIAAIQLDPAALRDRRHARIIAQRRRRGARSQPSPCAPIAPLASSQPQRGAIVAVIDVEAAESRSSARSS